MKTFIRVCAVFFAVHGASSFAEVRSIFKGQNSGLKRMTFGLTPQQTQKIFELTQGQVNFGDVYYVDHVPSKISLLSTQSGYTGTIYPDIPPPAQQKPAPLFGDPEIADQWWIKQLGVPEAWKMASGQGVTIADCDAGYYHDESDLHSNMLIDLRYDLSNKDEPLAVNDGAFTSHGTSVAAIMAGVLDGIGTNGIAYNAKVVPLQNFNYDTSDDLDKEEATAQCVLRAINTPSVNIIVLENQTENGSSETFIGTRDAVRLAIQAGITVVGAGGNYAKELIEERKDDTGSIIVGALKFTDSAQSYSNFGDRVTVGAYGEHLHTLAKPNGQFEDFGGTSGATPQVAATVALMKEVNPMLTPALARTILSETREVSEANRKAGGKLRTDLAVLRARELSGNMMEWSRSWLFREQLTAILSMK